jgi:ESCRT-II complex subunit VPS36
MFKHAESAFKDAHAAWVSRHQCKPAEDASLSVSHVGISGLLRQREEAAREVDTALKEAFTDLDSLMGQAQHVTALMDRLLVRAEAGDSAQGGAEIEQLLQALGMASPVTRLSAGAQYHEQLARQLVDFLEEPLRVLKTMSLADVYSLYCRARGTELVSPEDLSKAAQLWAPLALPLVLKRCASGALLVHRRDYDERAVMAQMAALVRAENAAGPGAAGAARWGGRGVSALEVSQKLHVSLATTKEYLRELERAGELCPAVGKQTVLYYANFFPEFELPAPGPGNKS